jgi:hypothetical protein
LTLSGAGYIPYNQLEMVQTLKTSRMRIIKEISHPAFRTTLFQWNNRYIIKLETGAMEQTFKIDQYEFSSDEEVLQLLDEKFLKQAMDRFEQMSLDMGEAMKRAQS